MPAVCGNPDRGKGSGKEIGTKHLGGCAKGAGEGGLIMRGASRAVPR